jgi:hypothetical protein
MALRTPYSKIAPAGGYYSLEIPSGSLTTVAANGPVWSCRWTSTTHVAVVFGFSYSAITTTAFGTAQDLAYGLYFARSFTAADTGGLAAVLTTNNGKHDTLHPTMLMSDIRIGDADVITAGTRTLDAQPLRAAAGYGAAALATITQNSWVFGITDSTHPLILRAEEGLVLNNLILMGASGVVKLRVTLEWTEVEKGRV